MSKLACSLLVVICLSLSACVAQTPATSTPVPQATVPAKTGALRVAMPPTPALPDIPYLIALDTLGQQGYVVETVEYARFDLVTAGLASGEVDIAQCSHQTSWAAIAKGAPIRAIADRVSNQYLIAAKAEIKTCADLQGKSIAYSATANVNAALADAYLKQTCPGTQPQTMVIPSSSNRVAALLSGGVDAAVLQLADALELEGQAPGKFRVLRYFAEEFPLVDLDAYYVHNDFASQHPDIVKDFVMAAVEANRRVQDPQILREAIQLYLPDDATALANADIYLARKAWDVNGGLTPEHIQYTLAFLTDAGMVPSGLQVEQLVDSSFLSAVLDEIGRK